MKTYKALYTTDKTTFQAMAVEAEDYTKAYIEVYLQLPTDAAIVELNEVTVNYQAIIDRLAKAYDERIKYRSDIRAELEQYVKNGDISRAASIQLFDLICS